MDKPMPVIAILSEKPLNQYASSFNQHSYSKPGQNYVETEYQPNKEDTEDSKTFLPSEHQQIYSKYRKPKAEFLKPYADYQDPYAEFQKSYADFKKHYPDHEKPYGEYQKAYVKYPNPYVQYQKPYVLDYPKYAPIGYTNPHPEDTRVFAPLEYVKPRPSVEYRPLFDHVAPYASVDAPTVLYARPTASGGYTYHKRPQKKRNLKRQKPVILRVHKYRVIRDRSFPELSYMPTSMM